MALIIPMILNCPECLERHIDVGEFATKPHHTHACQTCGFVWRPALVDTVGVQFLPGFKNESPAVERDEAWCHAACLHIAEGQSGWSLPTAADSPAMVAVRQLRHQYELLKGVQP